MMTLPTVTFDEDGDFIFRADDGFPTQKNVAMWAGMPDEPWPQHYAVVRVEDGKAVDPESLRALLPAGSVLVMKVDGEWPRDILMRIADAIDGPLIPDDVRRSVAEMAAKAALDAQAEDAS